MPAFICTACGMQYAPSPSPPAECRVCEDERQFTPPGGQSWTTLDALAVDHLNAFRQHEPGLIGIGTRPQFAIGQRALLVCTPHGNILWDCISLIDEATVTLIKGLGGLNGHRHLASAFLHHAGRVEPRLRQCARASARRRCGLGDAARSVHRPLAGRDPGAAAGRDADPRRRPLPRRHHAALGGGRRGPRACVCSADIATVNLDRKSFTFMRSYPNNIPLSEKGVRAIGAALAPFQFDRVYSHFFERAIPTDAKRILQDSIERYVAAIGGAYDRV